MPYLLYRLIDGHFDLPVHWQWSYIILNLPKITIECPSGKGLRLLESGLVYLVGQRRNIVICVALVVWTGYVFLLMWTMYHVASHNCTFFLLEALLRGKSEDMWQSVIDTCFWTALQLIHWNRNRGVVVKIQLHCEMSARIWLTCIGFRIFNFFKKDVIDGKQSSDTLTARDKHQIPSILTAIENFM